KLMKVNELLKRKINFFKKKRSDLINELETIDKIKFRLEQSKHFTKELAQMTQKLSQKYPIIDKYGHYKTLLEKIRELLFTTPLFMHIINYINDKEEFTEEKEQNSVSSIFLSFIEDYEKKYDFLFDEKEVLEELEDLKDYMTKMWVYFRERHFNFALKQLTEISSISIDDKDYAKIVNDYLDKLLPIIAIYEIFNRPLFESVYPESIPQTKRLGAYIARFVTSKYNPIGINLMKLFNRLAFHNWSYLILKKKLNRKQFFNYLLKLPIWKHIPAKIKTKILNF
ncbi:MAG: hypothetical protein ACFFA6_16275, partial [Promethearchaeota archaeon]